MNFNEVQFTDSTENMKASKVLIVASETRGEKLVGAKGIIVDYFVSNLESLLNKKSSILFKNEHNFEHNLEKKGQC